MNTLNQSYHIPHIIDSLFIYSPNSSTCEFCLHIVIKLSQIFQRKQGEKTIKTIIAPGSIYGQLAKLKLHELKVIPYIVENIDMYTF